MEIEHKEDRRSRRTRKLLVHALFGLMQEKRYTAITVKDIIERADVGRSTFYSHCRDKEDLLEDGLDEMIQQFYLGSIEKGQYLFPVLQTFQHIQKEQHRFKSLATSGSIDRLYQILEGYMRKNLEILLAGQVPAGQEPIVPIPVLAASISGSFLALLKWYMENKMVYSPEQMDQYFQQLVMPGALAGLGK
jgi:AcrR family transcriptional regulator